jgi:pSer/pThr/pTyr-binding forkhead associated (FHA) protein
VQRCQEGVGLMARLTIFREGQSVMEHTLPRPVITLGRHTDNDIVLDDLALSRFHTRLEQRADKHVVVDLGSQNGVYVNGTRIQGEQILRAGDRIGIGRYVAVYDVDAAEKRAPLRGQTQPAAAAIEDDGDTGTGPQLVLLYNGAEMERFPLTGAEHVIGRSHKCDVVIGLLGLSRRHARVYRLEDGSWAVEDLGSQNGTFVNDEKIESTHVMQDGDVINFFEYSVVFNSTDGQTMTTGPDVTAPQPRPSGDVPQSTLVEDAPEPLTGALRGAIAGATDAMEGDGEEEARGFETGATEMESGLPQGQRARTRTGAAPLPPEPDTPHPGPAALWPTDRDTEEALTLSSQLAPAGLLEVRVDNRLMTEVPLDRAALRIGSDARCDVALPPLTSISGWHLVVVRMGGTVVLNRVGDSALPRVDGRPVAQAFLQEGDRVELGRVTLVYRRR